MAKCSTEQPGALLTLLTHRCTLHTGFTCGLHSVVMATRPVQVRTRWRMRTQMRMVPVGMLRRSAVAALVTEVHRPADEHRRRRHINRGRLIDLAVRRGGVDGATRQACGGNQQQVVLIVMACLPRGRPNAAA